MAPENKTVETTLRKSFEKFGDLSVVSFSSIGSSHEKSQKPNQDFYFSEQKLKVVTASVADGLGSCEFSNEGSRFIAETIVYKMNELIKPLERKIGLWEIITKQRNGYRASDLERIGEEKLKSNFIESINFINRKLEELADEKNKNIDLDKKTLKDENELELTKNKITKDSFASTCLLALTDGEIGFFSQIGDGGIYLIQESQTIQICFPTKGEMSNETVPVTHREWENYSKFSFMNIPKDALFLCLMTDGFADYITAEGRNDFFQEITSNIKKNSVDDFFVWLEEMNNFFEKHGFSDDDKTVTFIFFKKLFKEV